MPNKAGESYEQEYESRFAWRKDRQIFNLTELSGIAGAAVAEPGKAFPTLLGRLVSDDPKDALRQSILLLWLEATECYIFGHFQACILTCGAAVERSLKLEYEEARGALPAGAKWTLGTCIGKCKGLVAPEVLCHAQQILDPRNDRAHALLEHRKPQSAILGGAARGIEIRSSGHALIEHFRGDAKKVIRATFQILDRLYGAPSAQA